jgi:hypothetical protein
VPQQLLKASLSSKLQLMPRQRISLVAALHTTKPYRHLLIGRKQQLHGFIVQRGAVVSPLCCEAPTTCSGQHSSGSTAAVNGHSDTMQAQDKVAVPCHLALF